MHLNLYQQHELLVGQKKIKVALVGNEGVRLIEFKRRRVWERDVAVNCQ